MYDQLVSGDLALLGQFDQRFEIPISEGKGDRQSESVTVEDGVVVTIDTVDVQDCKAMLRRHDSIGCFRVDGDNVVEVATVFAIATFGVGTFGGL